MKLLMPAALAALMILFLSGCNDVPEEVKKRKVQKVDTDLYKVPPLPEPEPVLEEEEEPSFEEEPPIKEEDREEEDLIPEVSFPDERPLLRERWARHLRGQRASRSKRLLRERPSDPPQEEWVLSQEDYQQGETTFDQDLSTLPVDRTRILTADMRIPAILEDSVNTQTPGRLIAVVDKDVLSPNGKKILLPAYTRLICSYEGLETAHSSRLRAQCHRLIRPDGVSIGLRDATTADQMGRSGLIGDLDKRTLERYGAAFAVSGISALAQAASSLNKQEAYANTTNQLSNNLGQVTQKVLEQNLDLTPILTIPQGARLQIIPLNDITFKKPYRKAVS